jgi:uncharacterized protein
MKYLLKNKFLHLFFSLIVYFSAFAQRGIPEKPIPPRLVNDFSGILSQSQINSLERKLVDFSDSTGTQIVVVTVNDLSGYDRAEFTYSLLNKWKVGQKGKNNGIVIMVKPTGGEGERHAFIAPGLGLEGIIPDVTAKRIVENEMIPYLKKNQYYEGIIRASDVVISLANQEFTAADYESNIPPSPIFTFLPLLLIILFYVLMSKARTKNASYGHKTSLWTLLMLMSAANRSHGGSFGKFNSGGGSFGGFGGGRSGGGGAGGSW